jgi:hypothetical protein
MLGLCAGISAASCTYLVVLQHCFRLQNIVNSSSDSGLKGQCAEQPKPHATEVLKIMKPLSGCEPSTASASLKLRPRAKQRRYGTPHRGCCAIQRIENPLEQVGRIIVHAAQQHAIFICYLLTDLWDDTALSEYISLAARHHTRRGGWQRLRPKVGLLPSSDRHHVTPKMSRKCSALRC